MKKRQPHVVLSVALLFFGFLLGFFTGRNYTREAVLISVPPQMLTSPTVPTQTSNTVSFPIDINTASEAELTALPKIGDTLAFRILSYRRERGKFHNIYDLLNVEGITENILSEIEDLVYIGG